MAAKAVCSGEKHLQKCDNYNEHLLVGSLAGAAQPLKDNAVVQNGAQRGQKSLVDEKAKSSADFAFQYHDKL